MVNLFLFELRSRWKAMLGWSIGLIAFGSLYVGIFPEMADEMASLNNLSVYRLMGIDMGTFDAYIGSVVLLFLPILLGVYGIITSTKALAGEEDAGTLELIMAKPISRWQIVIAKALAIGIALLAILIVSGLGDAVVLLAINTVYDTSLAPVQLFSAVLNGWPIVMGFAMISLFLGAFFPNRRIASMTATVLLIASYFGENIGSMVDSMEWMRPISLFTYYDTSAAIFTHAPESSDLTVLFGTIIVFLALALISFQRRNVTVGAWPWVRNRVPAAR
jgi:ABC-2 type transport system permease protein